MNRRLTCSALPSERPRGIRAVDRPSMRDPSGGPVLVMRRVENCISALAAAAMAATIGSIALIAQVPGRNVNMVSGTTLPDGDPFLQRQNEPSVAASTRNPQHLLAGANDYRTVDLPGLPDDLENGDAWLGNGKRIAAGNVYIVFTVFNGPGAAAASESDRPENIQRDKDDDQRDKDGERKDSDDEERLHGRIMFSRSRNCGATWSKPERISSADDVNQGAAIAIDPSSGTIYVAWRQFADPVAGTPDSIMVTHSRDGGDDFET